MKYAFFSDFYKRMATFGVMYRFSERIALTLPGWQKFGFGDETANGRVANLVMLVMVYLMENDLRDEVDNLSEERIAEFINYCSKSFFGRELYAGMAVDVTRFILNTILRDNGRRVFFDCLDAEAADFKPRSIFYIEERNEGEGSRYRLGPDGQTLVLSTLEFEQNLKISVQNIILSMSLKKNDFRGARESAKQMYAVARRHYDRLSGVMDRLRANYSEYYSTDMFTEVMNATNSVILDPEVDLNEHLCTIAKKREYDARFGRDGALGDENDETRKKLADLGQIELYVSKVIQLKVDIQARQKEFERLCIALEDAAIGYMPGEKLRLSDVLGPTSDIATFDRLTMFLSLMFARRQTKVFDPAVVFTPRDRVQREPKERRVTKPNFVDTEYDGEVEGALERAALFRAALKAVLEYAIRKGQASLSDIRHHANEDVEFRSVLLADSGVFKELYARLAREDRPIPLFGRHALQSSAPTYDVRQLAISIGGELGGCQGLSVSVRFLEKGKSKVIFGDVPCVDGMAADIKCDDLTFALGKEID